MILCIGVVSCNIARFMYLFWYFCIVSDFFNVDDHVIIEFRLFYFFLFGIPFISFSRLLTLTRIFNSMLSISVENGQLYLVFDLSGKSFSLLVLNVPCRFPIGTHCWVKEIPFYS